MKALLTPVALALLVACGSGDGAGDGGGGYVGTFSIQGVPHPGRYHDCRFTGASIACQGIDGCGVKPEDCGLRVYLPGTLGTYRCSTGQVSITVSDPGFPGDAQATGSASALCSQDPTGHPDGPDPNCPTLGGCGQLIGDCTAEIDSAIPSPGAADPWGHFSGTLTGSLWTSFDTNGLCEDGSRFGVEGSGENVSVTLSGGW